MIFYISETKTTKTKPIHSLALNFKKDWCLSKRALWDGCEIKKEARGIKGMFKVWAIIWNNILNQIKFEKHKPMLNKIYALYKHDNKMINGFS